MKLAMVGSCALMGCKFENTIIEDEMKAKVIMFTEAESETSKRAEFKV